MTTNKPRVAAFYRIIKAEKGHPFAGLYAVEKVFFRGTDCIKREIVHEWDLRIISESILAKLGGGDAYESFKLDNEIGDLDVDHAVEVQARTAEDLKDLTAPKLKSELKLKSE